MSESHTPAGGTALQRGSHEGSSRTELSIARLPRRGRGGVWRRHRGLGG